MADGERILDYVVTYLAMDAPPAGPPVTRPSRPRVALLKAEAPPAWYFLDLYARVGRPYEWTDWLSAAPDDVEAFACDPAVELFTLMTNGWPGGFFMLDRRDGAEVELAYFGLMPEWTGRGLGGWLLDSAIRTAWAEPGTRRLTVNTCTLDHPGALGLYQKHGFGVSGREAAQRVARTG